MKISGDNRVEQLRDFLAEKKNVNMEQRHQPMTIAQQIADDISRAIVHSVYKSGDRIGEQELADFYNVSRGPIREAIRIVEVRGLLEVFPRRGAFAIGLSLDMIADIVNLQTVYLSLAIRYFQRFAEEKDFCEIEENIAKLRQMVDNPDISPIHFALKSGRIGALLKRRCGSKYFNGTERLLGEGSMWSFIWHQYPVDYLTRERRQECVVLWEETIAALRQGNDTQAIVFMEKQLWTARDAIFDALSRNGAEVDQRRIFNALTF